MEDLDIDINDIDDIDIDIEIYSEELVHMTMGTEKSHNLPSVSWRPRTAGATEEDETRYSSETRKKGVSSSFLCICSILASMGRMKLTHIGEGRLLYSVYRAKY